MIKCDGNTIWIGFHRNKTELRFSLLKRGDEDPSNRIWQIFLTSFFRVFSESLFKIGIFEFLYKIFTVSSLKNEKRRSLSHIYKELLQKYQLFFYNLWFRYYIILIISPDAIVHIALKVISILSSIYLLIDWHWT
jgi:hypothetical protein